MQSGTLLPRLIDEYGSNEDSARRSKTSIGADGTNLLTQLQMESQKKLATALMQAEERNTGAVTWDVYGRYLKYAGSALWAVIIFGLLITNEGSQGNFTLFGLFMLNPVSVVDSIFLGWWTSLKFSDLTQGQYMGIYAGIGLFSLGVLQHN
jgi:ATP-binding cassette, subfamily C (CFTR/MRP), member 1